MRKLNVLLALAALAGATGALAQTYPTKPIFLYIPFAAGGPTDTLGRNLAQVMGKPLKQQLIVENVVGAGGTIAVARAAKADRKSGVEGKSGDLGGRRIIKKKRSVTRAELVRER